MCLNTVGGRVDSMPYGRPIIRSLSQNYHEAEVKYFFSPIFTSDKEIAKIIDKRARTEVLFFQDRDVLLSCEVEALGENLVIWKQGDRTISAGSIMVG